MKKLKPKLWTYRKKIKSAKQQAKVWRKYKFTTKIKKKGKRYKVIAYG